MAKLTLTDIESGYQVKETINSNNTATETAVENTLSRDGTSPNQMEAPLDMNSFNINNLPDATQNQQPVTLSQAASIAGVTSPLTRETVGAVFYPETSAETSASVTPTNYYFAPDDPRRLNFLASNSAADNTTALANMALVGGIWKFRVGGTYAISATDVDFAAEIHIRGTPDVIIQPAGPSSAGPLLDFSADDSGIEGVHFDLQNVDDYQVIGLSGDRTYCRVSADSMGAKSGASSGSVGFVDVGGNDNRIWVDVRGFANTGASNESFPRIIQLKADAVDPTVEFCRARGANAGITAASGVTRPRLQYIELDDLTDNGVYNLGANDLHFDYFFYHGDEEAWVEKGTRTRGGTIKVLYQDGQSAALGFHDHTDFACDSVIITDTTSTNFPNYIRTRNTSTACGRIRIGRVQMRSRANVALQFNDGTVESLEIDTLDIEHHYFDAVTAQTFGVVDLSVVEAVSIGRLKMRIIDDTSTLTASNHFTFTLDSSLSEQSYIGKVELDMDGGDYDLRIINVAQNNMSLFFPYIDSSARIVPFERKAVWSDAAPSAGTWATNDVALNASPVAGQPMGWVCTSGGSPGTWIPFGGVQSADAWTDGAAHTTLRDTTGTSTAAHALQLIETLIADLQDNGILQ
jgi:hypothetical protein